TSSSLLQRLRQPSDAAAWSRFVELYSPLLFSWARRLGLQESDAADLIQDVFATLVNKLPAFAYDRSKSFRAWLRTVALNQYRVNLRRRAGNPARAAIDPDALAAPESEAVWEDEYRRHVVGRALEIMQSELDRKSVV